MRRERQRAATPPATGEARSRGAVAGDEHHRGPWAGPRRSLGTPSCAASAWRREGTPRREGKIEEEEEEEDGRSRRGPAVAVRRARRRAREEEEGQSLWSRVRSGEKGRDGERQKNLE